MRVHGKVLSIFLAFLLVMAVSAPSVLADDASGSIRILFTHDMHASLEPAKAEDETGQLMEAGGFARLYAAIKQARAVSPESTLLVDAGDYTMGTLFQTVEATQSPELRLMGMMGYDATTVGNHEFDYTIDGFTASLNAAADSGDALPPYVISNMTLPDGNPQADALQAALDNYGVQDYRVVDKGGCRIGIFGVLGEEAVANAPMSVPAEFEDINDSAKRMVSILQEREHVDLIVCLSHSGTKDILADSEDEQLAKAVPDIDVIISGHTHTLLQQPILVGDTIIASCGSDSTYLGQLDIVQQDGVWKVQDYALQPIDGSLTGDTEIQARVNAFKALADEYLAQYGYSYDEVIAYSPYQYTTINDMYAHPDDYALGDITADAYMYAVSQAEGEDGPVTDAAVVPMGIIRATINQGDITVADAFKILSLGTGPDGETGYPLVSVYLYGWELTNVCEVDASVSGIMSDAQLFFAGLQYTYNPNRLIFNKVTDVQLVREDGSTEAVDPDRLYRVVCSLYSGQMLSYVKEQSFGILSITPKDESGEAVTDFNSRIIYTQDGRELKEWESVVSFLGSFEEQNAVGTIPAIYAQPQGRKTADTSGGLAGILSHPTTFAWIVYGVIAVLIAVIVLVIVLIVRGAKKRRARRGVKAAAEA